MKMTQVAEKMRISVPTVILAAKMGETVAFENNRFFACVIEADLFKINVTGGVAIRENGITL